MTPGGEGAFVLEWFGHLGRASPPGRPVTTPEISLPEKMNMNQVARRPHPAAQNGLGTSATRTP